MNRVAVLCARGGSVGLPGKNTRLIAGRPLIAWSIAQALESGLFSHVAVSSDAPDILRAAREAGASFLVTRPDHLATDTISVLQAVEHCLAAIEQHQFAPVREFVLLQATSPTREVSDILGAVALFAQHGSSSVITGSASRASPYFSLVEQTAEGTVQLSKLSDPPIVRRQDAPPCFDMNGSIYVVDRAKFAAEQRILWPDTRLYEMSAENSVDIDTLLDFQIAEMIMQARYPRA